MLRRAADDSSLAAALGGRLSPSPWSRFLSPSLFSQCSATPTLAPAHGSPLKESTSAQGHQPGQFTHAKEINPFERSFAVVDPDDPSPLLGVGPAPGGGAALLAPENLAAAQHEHEHEHGTGRLKRRRALSSPALFTPGGSFSVGDGVDAFLQAKRPALRFGANVDSGIGLTETSSVAAMVPSEAGYSLRSSAHNSFDSTTGSSLLSHRRAQSLTQSPDTSVAPSPPSPKLGAGVEPGPFVSDGPYAHFQPQPMAFSMPPVATMPYADAGVLAMTTLAPASIAPHAVAPLPFATDAPPFDAAPMPLDPLGSYAPYAPVAQAFAPPPVDPSSLGAPIPHGVPAASLAPAPLPVTTAPGMLVGQPPMPMAQTQFPPIPSTSLAPSTMPLPAPIHPNPAPPPPPAPKPAAKKKAAAASAAAKASVPAPAAKVVVPAATGDAPAPAAPTKPPGKKRGRKPKNWDPTLEMTVELDPEEQERQRKLALERNRIAASKSRRRKKERVELLETASTDLCTRNMALQAECRTLLTEVHSLRTMLAQVHPEHSCACPHIVGYVVREREGGGIPAIMYGAGQTVDRDYSRVPKWGTEDDVFAGVVEAQALDAFATGSSLAGFSTGRGDFMCGGSTSTRGETPSVQGLEDLAPVVGPAHGGIPLKAPGAAAGGKKPFAPAPSGSHPQSHMTRRASAAAAANAAHSEDEDEESEPEAIELKSRRARAITARNK
ncbi:hypothetical protein JCM10450v2_007155 [Rhodotorula kratochvilovae]